MTTLAPALQAFFTERLVSQRAASPNTIAGYKQTFRLLLCFASARCGRAPSQLSIDDLDAPMISAFLSHLEKDRGNSPSTRNNRLAAVHSMFAYVALHYPEHAATAQRVLAIPAKRTRRTIVTYLTSGEADAVLAACDQDAWTGRRDHAMLALALQAGLRISELASLTRQDIVLTAGAHVHTIGKGRKERRTPLVPAVKKVLKSWLAAHPGAPGDPLFPGSAGRRLSRDAIERRLALAVTAATEKCPSLCTRSGTPRPCGSWKQATTSPSSPCGWVTSRPQRRTSTFMPT
jgi:integrase/recombinase XerD